MQKNLRFYREPDHLRSICSLVIFPALRIVSTNQKYFLAARARFFLILYYGHKLTIFRVILFCCFTHQIPSFRAPLAIVAPPALPYSARS